MKHDGGALSDEPRSVGKCSRTTERLYCLTVKQYRINLGWTRVELAKQAGLSRQSIANAEAGKSISAPTAKAIAEALSRGYCRTIRVADIEGLSVR
jgi:DNA-binding XRE family transcriptional regulator